MKLVYVANVRIPTGKAHGVQIMKMCEAFADLGMEVELWAPTRYNIIKVDPFDYFGTKRNFKIIKIPSLDLVRYGWLGFWIQKITFIFFSTARAIFCRAEVFYSRDELFVLIARLLKKNIYWEAHTNALNRLVKAVINSNVRMVVISNGLKQFFISHGVREEKILVAHDGVSLKDFEISATKNELRKKIGLPQEAFVVSYIGKYTTMGGKKGVDELIFSFSSLVKKYPNLFLLIVGINKSEVSGLESLFQKENVDMKNYYLSMYVPHKDIPMYLKLSDILVMNYPTTEHYSLYMSPLKMFEYMASGVPIITTDLPSVREVLNESSAIMVKPENKESLSAGIESLAQNQNIGEKISRQALENVRNYEWRNRAEKILTFIKE